MKSKIYFIAILMIGSSISCNSKPTKNHEVKSVNNNINIKHTTVQQTTVDNIEITDFIIKKAGGTGIILGDSITNVVNAFGQPDSIYNYYFEIEEQNATVYQYNTSKFYFLNNKLDSYEVDSHGFYLGNSSSNTFFSIGSNLTTLLPLIPNYAANKKLNRTYANFSHNGVPYDMFILIEYNPGSENITKVSIRTY